MKRFLFTLLFMAMVTGLTAFEYVGRSENNIDFFECETSKDVAAFFKKNPDAFTLEKNLSGIEKRTDKDRQADTRHDFYIIGVLPEGSWVIIHRTTDYDYIFLPLEE